MKYHIISIFLSHPIRSPVCSVEYITSFCNNKTTLNYIVSQATWKPQTFLKGVIFQYTEYISIRERSTGVLRMVDSFFG